jgi:hypothetical protein
MTLLRAREGLNRRMRQLRPAPLEVPLSVLIVGSTAQGPAIKATCASIMRQTARPQRVIVPQTKEDCQESSRSSGVVVDALPINGMLPMTALMTLARSGPDLAGDVFVTPAGGEYPSNLLATLYRERLLYPMAIIARRCLIMKLGPDGHLGPPDAWPQYSGADSRLDLMPDSEAGVLYPGSWLTALGAAGARQRLAEAEPAPWHDLWARSVSLADGVPVRCVAFKAQGDAAPRPATLPPSRLSLRMQRLLVLDA